MARKPDRDNKQQAKVTRADVGRGAAMAALGRLGALVELVAQPVYVWLYGLAIYGLYIALWSAVNFAGFVGNWALHQGLQRLVPAARSEEAAHGAVKFALLLTIGPGLIVAVLIGIFANPIAAALSAPDTARPLLGDIIRAFAWCLPLLIMLEIATAAARARRAFGPEIRLRIFWEQATRLGFAVLLFYTGFEVAGLFWAHIGSLAVTALLSLRLLGRYYDLGLLWRARIPGQLRRDVMATGLAMLPPNIMRRAFNDLPPLMLNLILPGASGAISAGLYGIARKVASVPLIVRQAFLYVLAPLSSAQAAIDRAAIAPLYGFANRLAAIIAIPRAMGLILIGDAILLLFTRDALAAMPILVVLLAGRAAETVFGAATPIVEMTGHRILPLLNSLAGLAVAAMIAWWLLPEAGAVGMALAVAAGVTLASLIAMFELSRLENLPALDRHFGWALMQQSACAMMLYVAGLLLAEHPMAVRVGTIITMMLVAIWAGLKWALDREDKAALGRVTKFLHL